MPLTGESLVGRASVRGVAGDFHAVNPRTGERLMPAFGGVGLDKVARACEMACSAFDVFRETALSARAAFLDAIAARILETGEELLERAVAETGLPRARIEAERGRTVGQLRFFADLVREGSFLEPRIDPEMPHRKPLARVDLRQRHIAVGPVAVFGASNFPLAFSVAGGDTASALAAGCPVVVKAHNAHPGTSELVGRALQRAVADCELPEGVFSMLFAVGNDVGAALVAHPRIKAVGFTGSRTGGTALIAIAAQRREPIPVYAEMSSINPVYLLPEALRSRARPLGSAFAGSLMLGAGQMCTNPGLVLAVDDPALADFVAGAADVLSGTDASTMLTESIHTAFETGVKRLAEHRQVQRLAQGRPVTGANQCRAAFFDTDARTFLADERLHQEVFGASSLLVRCRDFAELQEVAEGLEGQLTATLHLEAADMPLARRLIPILERKAGRILVNGFPTGVEVAHAMVHGGPYPSSSDGRTTSVGSLAIRRFLRPVCYQNVPGALLPDALMDGNPLGLWRRIDGQLVKQ